MHRSNNRSHANAAIKQFGKKIRNIAFPISFSKPLPSTKEKEKKWKAFFKLMNKETTRKRRSDVEKMAEAEAGQEKLASTSSNANEVTASFESIVKYTEEELTAFKEMKCPAIYK